MTQEEAKFLLRAYRPDGQDAQRPEFAKALELVDQNPELKSWFESELAFDQAIAAKVQQEKVPDELLASILVANKVTKPHSSSWSLGGLKWAVALLFVGAIVFTALKGRGNDHLAQYRSDVMAHLKVQGYHFDHVSRDFNELNSWMKGQGTPGLNIESIQNLTSLPTHGCRIMNWEGQKVTLICFQMPDFSTVHLFVFHEMEMADPNGLQDPVWREDDGWTTVGWTSGSNLFMLAGQMSKREMSHYL